MGKNLEIEPVDDSDNQNQGLGPLQIEAIGGGGPSPASAPATSGDSDESKSDDSSDSDSDSDSGDDSTPSAAPAQGQNPVIAAYLRNLQEMRAAQAQAKQNQLGTGISAALAQIGHGIARAPGATDLSAINEAAKSDDQPVKNILAQQTAGAQAMQTAKTLEDNDPNSASSRAMRASVERLAPGVVQQYGDQWQYVTAADQDKVLKPIELKATLDERAQAARDRTDLMREKSQAVTDQKQLQSYNQTVQQLEQMRGSPAAAQAEKDIYASQKANSLIKVAAPDGDLNSMSDGQAQLLKMELAKIASGGQASQAELNALDPGTLTGKLSKVWGQLSNNPTPANAGAFLKQYKDYSDSLTRDAQQVITDRYGRFINARKDQFSPSQNQSLQDIYVNRFKPQVDAIGASPSTTYSQDVQNYAKAHGITPAQAQSIKDQRTSDNEDSE